MYDKRSEEYEERREDKRGEKVTGVGERNSASGILCIHPYPKQPSPAMPCLAVASMPCTVPTSVERRALGEFKEGFLQR